MSNLWDLMSVNYIIFEIGEYPMSFIEFIGTLLGLVSVWQATRLNIFTWPTGIVNQIAFFFLFYQVQLYSDMLLQVYFTGLCIYGWIHWKRRPDAQEIVVSRLGEKQRLFWTLGIVGVVIAWGTFMAHIHTFFPAIFPQAAAYPYMDAATAVTSIAACFLMARKIVEAWVLWILVDIVSIVLYALKGVYFVTGEYCIFLGMASYGLFGWMKENKQIKPLVNFKL